VDLSFSYLCWASSTYQTSSLLHPGIMVLYIHSCSIIKRIEGILIVFLWKNRSLSHLGDKVTWAYVCYPLKEDGLGIKRV